MKQRRSPPRAPGGPAQATGATFSEGSDRLEHAKRIRSLVTNALRADGRWKWHHDAIPNVEIAQVLEPTTETRTKAEAFRVLEHYAAKITREIAVARTPNPCYKPRSRGRSGGSKDLIRRATLPAFSPVAPPVIPPPSAPLSLVDDGTYWLDTGWACGAVHVEDGEIVAPHPSTAPVFRRLGGAKLDGLSEKYHAELLTEPEEYQAMEAAQRATTYEYLMGQLP